MFYIYTILLPVLILVLNYYTNPRPKKASEYVSVLLKAVPHVLGYAFLLYFLEREDYINTSWTSLLSVEFGVYR